MREVARLRPRSGGAEVIRGGTGVPVTPILADSFVPFGYKDTLDGLAMTGSDRPPWLRLSGVGFEFAAALICFALVGLWVDRRWDCRPWGVVIGSCLGLIGGTYNLIRTSLAAFKELNPGDGDQNRTEDDNNDD